MIHSLSWEINAKSFCHDVTLITVTSKNRWNILTHSWGGFSLIRLEVVCQSVTKHFLYIDSWCDYWGHVTSSLTSENGTWWLDRVTCDSTFCTMSWKRLHVATELSVNFKNVAFILRRTAITMPLLPVEAVAFCYWWWQCGAEVWHGVIQ